MVIKNQYSLIEKQEDYWTLTLNNASKGNSYNISLIQEITDFFLELQKNEKIKLAVVRANGKNFCTGADLDWMYASSLLSAEENLKEMQLLADMYNSIEVLQKPILARINGKSLGGGLGLVSCCDFVVASDQCEFSLPEIQKKLIVGIATPFIIRKSGESHFDKWSETGEVFGAKEALAAGLVQQVKTEDEADPSFEKIIFETLNLDKEQIKSIWQKRLKEPIRTELLNEWAKKSAIARASAKNET